MEVTTIGLDLAKHVFQLHGVDASGSVVLKRRLRRREVQSFFAGLKPCLVGMEACATAHHWARELRALGHEVRLMPAQSPWCMDRPAGCLGIGWRGGVPSKVQGERPPCRSRPMPIAGATSPSSGTG